jgi:hypothetical protein
MDGGQSPHGPRPRALGREPQWFAATGLVLGVVGAVWDRAQPAAATMAEGLGQLLRASLPGLLAVAAGLTIWALGSGAGGRLISVVLRVVVCAATVLAAVVIDLSVQAAREFLEASRPPGPSRWELPLRLTVSGLALGAVVALVAELIRYLTTNEGAP